MMKGVSMPGLPDWLMQLEIPFWAAALAGGAFAAIWALVFGAVLMRLSGIAASIATFAMLAMVNSIYSNWDSVTAATSSVVGIPIVRTVWPYLVAAVLAVSRPGPSRSAGMAWRCARRATNPPPPPPAG